MEHGSSVARSHRDFFDAAGVQHNDVFSGININLYGLIERIHAVHGARTGLSTKHQNSGQVPRMAHEPSNPSFNQLSKHPDPLVTALSTKEVWSSSDDRQHRTACRVSRNLKVRTCWVTSLSTTNRTSTTRLLRRGATINLLKDTTHALLAPQLLLHHVEVTAEQILLCKPRLLDQFADVTCGSRELQPNGHPLNRLIFGRFGLDTEGHAFWVFPTEKFPSQALFPLSTPTPTLPRSGRLRPRPGSRPSPPV